MNRVVVKQAKHTKSAVRNVRGPMNWRVVQYFSIGSRTLIYANFASAMLNADRLARGAGEVTVDHLRGFHRVGWVPRHEALSRNCHAHSADCQFPQRPAPGVG